MKPKRGDRVLAWNDDKSKAVVAILIDDIKDIYPDAECHYVVSDRLGRSGRYVLFNYKNVELIEDEIKLYDVVEFGNVTYVVIKIDDPEYCCFNPETGHISWWNKERLKQRKDLVAHAPCLYKTKSENILRDSKYLKNELEAESYCNDWGYKLIKWPSRPIDFVIYEVES